MVRFDQISDFKRQPTVGKPRPIRFPSGFPTPMGKQMSQPTKIRKLRFPSPDRIKRGVRTF